MKRKISQQLQKVRQKWTFDLKACFLPLYTTSLLIVFCLMFLCGCAYSQASLESSEVTTDSDNADTVHLEDVEPPKFMQKFAVLYYDDKVLNVKWGWTQDTISEGYFWGVSSYPGFNYTVIIQYSYFEKSDKINLVTKYGKYTYSFVKDYDVYVENGELISKVDGSEVNQLDPDNEHLVIYSSVQNKVFEYKLTEGTKISIESEN